LNLAQLSVAALAVAIVVSCFSRLNVGVLALALAWIVGVLIGGMKPEAVLAGFPAPLFITLSGMTMLFAAAEENGTLERLAKRAVSLCRGHAFLVPPMFFVIAATLASAGPGNISTAALVAPMAMSAASRAAIPPFLMAIMVGNGANAGSLSPLAPTGIIVTGLMLKIGLGGHEVFTWIACLAAHAAVGFGGYLLFGGLRLRGRDAGAAQTHTPFERRHWVTTGVIVALIASVILLKVHVGLAAFAAVVVLTLLGAIELDNAIKRMPWGVIVMVCGVTVLIALLEKTNGLALFTDLLARLSTSSNLTGVVAFVTGIISVYSSTSGVVLPAFLPTVPGLIERMGGGDALAVATAMNIGGHLVDVSPLSTIGALCLAGVTDTAQARVLFQKLLVWGLAMCVVGALGCWLLL
jgi:di/tricarboxylate transporter